MFSVIKSRTTQKILFFLRNTYAKGFIRNVTVITFSVYWTIATTLKQILFYTWLISTIWTIHSIVPATTLSSDNKVKRIDHLPLGKKGGNCEGWGDMLHNLITSPYKDKKYSRALIINKFLNLLCVEDMISLHHIYVVYFGHRNRFFRRLENHRKVRSSL